MSDEIYTTFSEIQDEELRNYNRGAVLANLYEDNLMEGTKQCSEYGVSAVQAYLKRIPVEELSDAMRYMNEMLIVRGLKEK